MPTARERMLELSELPSGNAARAHFLSITQTGSSGPTIYGEIEVLLMPDYDVEIDSEIKVTLDSNDYEVTLEPEYEVEICT